MSSGAERTPEQQRADRRAGIGCGTAILLAAVACAVGAVLQLTGGAGATRTTAQIVDCDFRVLKQPDRCRGLWRAGGEVHSGYVDGARAADKGRSIAVLSDGDSAWVEAGRKRTGVILIVVALLLALAGGGMLRSMVRRRVPAG